MSQTLGKQNDHLQYRTAANVTAALGQPYYACDKEANVW